MQSYRRIVSYLYRYTKDGKADNTGFVRVESRGEQLKLQFRIRDLRMMDRRKLTVCFYFHTQEGLKPVYVDEFFCDRGNCEYKKSHPGEKFDFEKMKGVLFFDSEGLLYGSCWDEQEIREERILRMKEEESRILTEEMTEKEGKPENTEILRETEAGREDVSEETKTENIISPLEKLLQNSVPLSVKDQGGYLTAVKIRLNDIAKLSVKDWKLATNPFLQQSYEMYGHLLLGRLKMQEEKEVWILGVPGIYDNREKYLANLFGFFDYIPEEEGEIWTGKKGYWFVRIE